MIWTVEMIKMLKDFVECKNFSYKEIAKIMTAEYGVPFTKNSCIGKGRRLGIPPRGVKMEEPVRILITDLRDGMCKWPFGEMLDKPPYFYCGAPTGDLGCSWCSMHRKKVWNKSTYASSFPSFQERRA